MALQLVFCMTERILKPFAQHRGPVIDDIPTYKVYMVHGRCVNPYLPIPYSLVMDFRPGRGIVVAVYKILYNAVMTQIRCLDTDPAAA